MTDDEARGLARRWAAAKDPADVMVMLNNILSDDERERLFAWVRDRMADALGTGIVTRPRRLIVAEGIGKRLGWGNDGRDPVCGTGDAPDEMEAWFADAWSLCALAGWPT